MQIPELSHSFDSIKHYVVSIREHMDVVLSAVTTVSTTLFFLGKATSEIPVQITRTAFLIQNAVGLAYLDWQVSFIVKTANDCWFALRTHTLPTLAITAATAVNAVSDVLLVIAGNAAALASWANRAPIAQAIYTVTRPWGLSFLVLTVALDFFSYFAHRSLMADLEQLSNSWWYKRQATTILAALSSFQETGKISTASPTTQLAARIRASLDKYTLYTLIDQSKSRLAGPAKHLQLIMQNVGTQQQHTFRSVGVRALGYVGMLLCKTYPDSLIHATTLLVVSLFYTTNQLYKRWQEAKHRKNLSQ